MNPPTNRCWLVRPEDEGRVIDLSSTPDAISNAIGERVDHGSLSRHFHYAVYEWSITENWPVNALMHRGDSDIPIHGPCLVYKTDDEGETIDLEDEDVDSLVSLWRVARAGANPNSLSLERTGMFGFIEQRYHP